MAKTISEVEKFNKEAEKFDREDLKEHTIIKRIKNLWDQIKSNKGNKAKIRYSYYIEGIADALGRDKAVSLIGDALKK